MVSCHRKASGYVDIVAGQKALLRFAEGPTALTALKREVSAIIMFFAPERGQLPNLTKIQAKTVVRTR